MSASILLISCSKDKPPVMPAMPVKVIEVVQRDTAISKDLVGEVRGSQEVNLNARVSGILTGIHFTEGALVKKGDLLFSIDPREYRAQAAAAEAAASRAELDVVRYKPLLAENAISKQIYDNAVATAKQTRAQADAANLGLEYANVRAPFDGRIGDSDLFVGGLVSAGVTVLATISNANPAWVYFSVSENDLLEFQRKMGTGELAADSPARKVRLTLGNGSEYPLEGLINFSDRALDTRTGTYRLRAEFANPDNILLPGMFVRIRVTGENLNNALLVPERSVIQQLGSYFVISVDENNKAVQKPIIPGPRAGAMWVIESGIVAGERIVVEGIQKARPGTLLQPILIKEADLNQPVNPLPSPAKQ
ncbi:MAG: efflux RND transporter periplasmic adaptor subunit [Arenimonas sp.]|nr:efflux RND transporter periplasmic adaptor subunit [Arenimonas sp.]